VWSKICSSLTSPLYTWGKMSVIRIQISNPEPDYQTSEFLWFSLVTEGICWDCSSNYTMFLSYPTFEFKANYLTIGRIGFWGTCHFVKQIKQQYINTNVSYHRLFFLWCFQLIPFHGLPLRGYAITSTGHSTLVGLLWIVIIPTKRPLPDKK